MPSEIFTFFAYLLRIQIHIIYRHTYTYIVSDDSKWLKTEMQVPTTHIFGWVLKIYYVQPKRLHKYQNYIYIFETVKTNGNFHNISWKYIHALRLEMPPPHQSQQPLRLNTHHTPIYSHSTNSTTQSCIFIFKNLYIYRYIYV